jgi:EAL domain-containing protein (putative c-di-GMP-specific phosphodiesterase class I)
LSMAAAGDWVSLLRGDEAHHRLTVQAGLRTALSEHQLRVFYQRIVSAGDGRTRSLEALVRWEDPERGLVPPGEFIPAAEAGGLIVDLGRFVLREACTQLMEWRREGVIDPDVSMAVNVSGRQLMSAGFVDEVRSALEDSGLAATPELLGLEITETVFMDNSDVAAATVFALAGLGVKLLLDDFGTGTSSLARLKGLPMDTLKIDRGFISGLGAEHSQDRAVVAAIMGMAAGMGLNVVAEGVGPRSSWKP